jgi:hypothetical protein
LGVFDALACRGPSPAIIANTAVHNSRSEEEPNPSVPSPQMTIDRSQNSGSVIGFPSNKGRTIGSQSYSSPLFESLHEPSFKSL